MDFIELNFDPSIRYQRKILTISPDDYTRRVRVDLRYLNETEKWYLSIYDAQSGEAFLTYVPLIASYINFDDPSVDEINDLLAPFHYKNLGTIICIPNVDNPTTKDPTLDNLNQFSVVWGDALV